MATVGRCPILGTPLEHQAPGSGSPCCTLEGWRGSEMEVSSYWCTPIYGTHHMSVPKNKVYLPTCACIYIYIHSIYIFIFIYLFMYLFIYSVCIYSIYIHIQLQKFPSFKVCHAAAAVKLASVELPISWRAPNKPPVMLWILITNVQTRVKDSRKFLILWINLDQWLNDQLLTHNLNIWAQWRFSFRLKQM